MHCSSILIIICMIFLITATAEEGCQFSAIRGELKCELLTSSDLRVYLPREDRDLVRWMTLYVGTSSQPHPYTPVPISYPDLSQFPKLSFLRVYIYSVDPSPNYTPDMFRHTGGAISIVTLYTVQPVPLDMGLIGTQGGLDRLKILRASNFNITGVTNGNLAALTSIETLQLYNAEGGGERVLLDSVFALGRTLPNMNKLSLERFQFHPLLTSEALLSPLPALRSLTLRMSPPSIRVDESVFFNARIFPALQVLELISFEFSNFENVNTFHSTPPLTRLRLHASSPRPLPLSRLAQPEGGAAALTDLSLENFNIGNISHTDLRHMPGLRSLYLSGSEDTIEVSSGAFSSNKQLSRLRLTYMPALQLVAPTALLGLTQLEYLHLGNLDSLLSLSPDTSSLTRLSSLYLTNNRKLAEVPVQLFRPLVSLQMLSVRSSLFDQECLCRHSFLSSLLTFSRPEPQFRLRSSCHDEGKFLSCQKNYQSSMCWDFEERCPHYCLPSGNLSYACACPRSQGALGGACVGLSRCGVSSDGIASHYCHGDRFSCVTHARNQTVSCSCYSDHALNPDSSSCRRLEDCSQTDGGYLCTQAGLLCSEGSCSCLEGRGWDPDTKTCLIATTTTPDATTTPITTTPTTSPLTTTPIIATTATSATTTTTPITTTTTTTTSATTATTTPITTTTTATTATTATTTLPIEITTEATTISAPTTTESNTAPSVSHTESTTVPTETYTVPTETYTVPTQTYTVPIISTTTTIEAATTEPTVEITTEPTTVPTTEPTDVTTVPTTIPTDIITEPTELTTVPTDVTTEPTVYTTEPTEPTLIAIEQIDSTAEETAPTETASPTLFPLSSDLTYVLSLSLGSLLVGTVIAVLIGLVVVLLAKILMYNRKSKYSRKPESMRSFESSNATSSPPTTFKELSV